MINKFSIYILLAITAGLLVGCASSQPASPEPSESTDTAATEAVATAEIVDDYDGDGMELTLDGSSMEAFDASMARIQRHTDEETYKSLNGAIGYLLVYDLEARGKKEVLITKLDGKSGYEIIAMVGWKKPAPSKSKPAKVPADAQTVDA